MSIYVSQQIAFKALMSGNGKNQVSDACSNNLDALSNFMIKVFFFNSQEKIENLN